MLTRQSVVGLTSVVASGLVLALTFGTASAASLKDKPPSGVKLSGIWKLDSERSDDPREVLDKAAKAAREKQEDARIARSDRGGVFGDDDPLGRYDRGPYGDPRSGPMDRGRGPYDRRLPGEYPDDPRRTTDGTVLRRDRDRGSTVDPTSGDVSASWGTGAQSINNVWLLQLDPSPDLLTVIDNGTHVSVSENKLETECKAGEKAPIADSFGDGQRQCGWNGKAWVIETKRDKRFTRTDRFELGKNGAILTYVTSASGSNMPSIRIFRTYTLVPATASP